jgi:hypothetical protein
MRRRRAKREKRGDGSRADRAPPTARWGAAPRSERAGGRGSAAAVAMVVGRCALRERPPPTIGALRVVRASAASAACAFVLL